MKMTFLGTGGAFSRGDTNYHNNVLLETEEGSKILIDCGTTALESLHELGVDPLDLDGVIVTHIHADHVGGLEELGFRGLFLGPKKRFDLYTSGLILPSMMNMDYDSNKHPDLWHNCLKGGMVHIQDAEGTAVQASLETYFRPHVMKTPEESFSVDGVSFMLVRTNHVPGKGSFGLVMESERGTKVFFSADSTSERRVGLENFDVIFHDCMFMGKYPSTVHTHFEEMVTLPRTIREKTFLMHYGDPEGAPSDLEGLRLAKKHQVFDL